MSEIGSVAGAVKESAKFGTQFVKTGEKAGGFLAKVFKEPTKAGVGMLTDQLCLMRLRRWDNMADEVIEILERRGVKDTKAVLPQIGLPLLESAAIETDSGFRADCSRMRWTLHLTRKYALPTPTLLKTWAC
jgi:hypothetical protein